MSIVLKKARKQNPGESLISNVKNSGLFDSFVNMIESEYKVERAFIRTKPDGKMIYFCAELKDSDMTGPSEPVNERIVRKRNFPTDFDHDGKKEYRTVYRGEKTNRFYSKRDWENQFERLE